MRFSQIPRSAFALLTLFIFLVFTGCGGSGGSSSSNTPPPPSGPPFSTLPTNQITISSVTPSTAPTNGNAIVTIIGSGFTKSPVLVYFGSQQGSALVLDNTTMHATAPASPNVGTVDIRIVNADGVSAITPNDRFIFTEAVPPTTTGSTTGGTTAGTTTGGTTTGATTFGTTTNGATTGGTTAGTTTGGTTTGGTTAGTTTGGTTTAGTTTGATNFGTTTNGTTTGGTTAGTTTGGTTAGTTSTDGTTGPPPPPI